MTPSVSAGDASLTSNPLFFVLIAVAICVILVIIALFLLRRKHIKDKNALQETESDMDVSVRSVSSEQASPAVLGETYGSIRTDTYDSVPPIPTWESSPTTSSQYSSMQMVDEQQHYQNLSLRH